MEVPLSVEIGYLSPGVRGHIIHLAFVHTFLRQRGTNCEDLRLGFFDEDRCQSMSPPFKEHISPLHQSFLDKFIASLSRLTWFSTSSQEDPTLFIFYGHEVRGNLDIDHV